MRKVGLSIGSFATVIIVLGLGGGSFAATLFEETFTKDATGNLSFIRTVVGEAGPATLVLTNGTGDGFDGVKKGRVELNSEVVYGGLDFKVTGTIFKTVALMAGNNAIDITLSGPVGGQMTIKVIQGSDEPTLEFPPGTVFVSSSSIASQDTAGCGATIATPCKSIGFGVSQGGTQTVVANGVYAESVTLVDGQDLLGGYNPEFTMRDLATLKAVIRGDPATAATVSAVGIISPTTLEGFTIFAPVRSEPSGDSIGIDVRNSSSALLIQNNLVFGGVAGDGADGVPGSDGVDGESGLDGGPVLRQFTTDALRGEQAGGMEGSLVVGGVDVSGGRGGSTFDPSYNVQNGSGDTGSGPSPGLGGAGGFHAFNQVFSCQGVTLPTNGPLDATNGANGTVGGNGAGGLGGVAGVGAANGGEDGTDGGPGSGGGGGGAGGGADADPSCDSVGEKVVYAPTGGGGGSGAGGGSLGTGGGGGGGAFGIFVDSIGIPVIGSNEIYLGIAGTGGHGGHGGVGGMGGAGGLGGPTDGEIDNGHAENGGRGGNGGHGGGGGGGAGGLSVGIFTTFDATGTYDVDNDVDITTGSAGEGGAGGSSLGNSGSDGQNGSVHATLFQP